VRVHTRWLAFLLIAAALALAGCGGGGGGAKKTPTPQPRTSGGGGGTKLSLAADKTQLKFNKSALSAKAGKVTIDMTNPSALQHDVAIQGSGVKTIGKVVGHGGTSTVTATLKPGTYTFFCSVDGHEQAGMKGALTVK
jgi:plastocyanin